MQSQSLTHTHLLSRYHSLCIYIIHTYWLYAQETVTLALIALPHAHTPSLSLSLSLSRSLSPARALSLSHTHTYTEYTCVKLPARLDSAMPVLVHVYIHICIIYVSTHIHRVYLCQTASPTQRRNASGCLLCRFPHSTLLLRPSVPIA